MSTISLKFGVHTRNWPGIDFKPLVFNLEFYFVHDQNFYWGRGDGWGGR